MNTEIMTEAYEALIKQKDRENIALQQKIEDLRSDIHHAAVVVQAHSSDNQELTELKNDLFTLAFAKD